MKHNDVRDRLGDYLEGALPLRDRALVDAHLDDCELCLRELDELRATVRMLRALSAVDEPADVTALVMRRIAAGEAEPSWWQRFLDAVDVWARPRALVAVAVGASALAGVLIFDPAVLRSGVPQPAGPLAGDPLAPRAFQRPLQLERELGASRAPHDADLEAAQSVEVRVLRPVRVPGLPPHVDLPLLEDDPMLRARTIAELRRRGLVNPRVQTKADVYNDFLLRQRQGLPRPSLGPPAFDAVQSTPVNYPSAQ